MELHWPQYTWIVLAGLGLLIHGSKHGEPMTGEYNGFVKLIAIAILAWVLWSGGFFTGGR